MGDKRPAVVEVWRCTIREDWDDKPALRVVGPPGTDTEEIGRFLVENEYVEPASIVPPYWLDDQPDDPEAEPGEDDLILERDSKGKLRVKED